MSSVNKLQEQKTLQEASQPKELEIEEMSMEKLFAQQEDFADKLYNREIVKVKVIQINKEYIFVDIGEKKEGLISVSEFNDDKNIPRAGDEITAVLVKKGREETSAILSHRKASEKKGMDLCRNAKESGERVTGIIRELIRGGYIVEVFDIRAFMPLSLSEMHPTYKHNLPVKAKIRCQVVEFSTSKKRVIVSRKQVLTEDEQKRRERVLSTVRENDILRVVVSKVLKDKLLLRYQGIEALVRIENIAWREPKNAIKYFERGQRLKAKLLFLDKEKYKLEFGLKQLYSNPADILRRKYPVKSVVKGKVTKITTDGMYVAVSSKTSGFVPAGEFGRELQHQEGKNISCVVLGINTKDFTLMLSVKRFEIVQNKRIVQRYLKKPKPLTLGQLLSKDKGDETQ